MSSFIRRTALGTYMVAPTGCASLAQQRLLLSSCRRFERHGRDSWSHQGDSAMKRASLILMMSAALTGCSSMSGLDAKNSFACKAPEGVLCESMSGVYANAKANNLPAQRVSHGGMEGSTPKEGGDTSGVLTRPIYSGTPIRTAPLVLRVWFAPWEDNDGDLHDQSYVYLPVDSGKWLIEHNRRRIADAYRPVRVPNVAATHADTQPRRGEQPAAAVSEPSGIQPRPSAQTAAEYMNGIVRPGMPGAVAPGAAQPDSE
jgi:conjugal transfer pilus assembly protein TraV